MVRRTGQALNNGDEAALSSKHPRPAEACALCGLPLGRGAIGENFVSDNLHFCCHGCQQVFLLLSAASGVLPENFRETELYRVCVESGIIPSPSAGSQSSPPKDLGPVPPLELSFMIEGMWCPSCAWLIEEVLRRTTGVVAPKASFVSDRLHLAYLPHVVSPDEIVERIGRLGYRLTTRENAGIDHGKKDYMPLAVSAFLTCNIMMASVVFYGLVTLPEAVVRSFSYPVLVMASVVLFYGGLTIFKRGFASLLYRAPGMDTLVSFGALSAYVYSLARMAVGALDLYFDTASMLVTFVLFGRYMETRARQHIRTGMADLYEIARNKVRTMDGRWVRADLIKPGESFIVAEGESVPVDSRVIGGIGTLDESFLTGESVPRLAGPGDSLLGGSTVRHGQVTLEATATAEESLVGRMAANMEEALERKGAYERFADRIGRFFVPVVPAVAACTGVLVLLSGASGGQALLRALTVLLIACPCTLGIAIPLAKVASVDLARRIGALVRNPEAFERMHTIDTVLFDKTGTLTEGNFSLQGLIHKGGDEKSIFSLLASVEVHSRHFIGKEIVREAGARGARVISTDAFETYEGLGVKGTVGDRDVYIGNRGLLALHAIKLEAALDEEAETLEKKGNTCVFFAWDGMVRGILVFGDPLREKTKETIAYLHGRGIDVWLISGDAESTTRAVAGAAGIRHCKGRVLPDGKVELVETLQRRGHRVAMIGDGINDGPALATADVGCAFGAVTDLIREASDITFLSPDLGKLPKVMELSALTGRTIRQNLFFAFLYNAVAIPVAAAGLLNPLIAVIAMVGSSLTVTLNTLRMSRKGIASVGAERSR